MITLHRSWSEPWDESDPKDVEAAQRERGREFEIGWFADPILVRAKWTTRPACVHS
jgi:beta-glucosidase